MDRTRIEPGLGFLFSFSWYFFVLLHSLPQPVWRAAAGDKERGGSMREEGEQLAGAGGKVGGGVGVREKKGGKKAHLAQTPGRG